LESGIVKIQKIRKEPLYLFLTGMSCAKKPGIEEKV